MSDYLTSCQKKGDRFVNPHASKIRRSLLDAILWKSGYYDEPALHPKVPETFFYPIPYDLLDKARPSVQWINHSSFLIKIDGFNILTDPIWSKRCSPFSFLGPKRQHSPSLKLWELPRIHYVLISHDHYDHLDKKSVLALHRQFPEITWLVPRGVAAHLRKWGIVNLVERSWWESAELNSTLKATAVPAQHFSGRTLFDLNKTLWAGWVVESAKSGKRFYFTGDTGYNPTDFKAIGARWPGMDLSLIPIGAYTPSAFMSPVHIDPKEAVRIHGEVGSKLSIGMHWKTFRLADEPLAQPPYDLFLTLKEEGLDPASFLALDPGYEINW